MRLRPWCSASRVSKHWQDGDKCLAAIYLAQSGLGKLDKQSACRLSLAAQLLDAGLTPRELARELGLPPMQPQISKYDDNQPRVPAGNGRESGRWTSGAASSGSTPTEGTSAAATAGGVNIVSDLPKDAVVVTRPDPKSPTGKLMAPPRANFQEVYAAGEKIASWPKLQQLDQAKAALQQFGTYDFQRDKATNSFYDEYVPAANYAVGVYMARAGYNLEATYVIAQGYAMFNSSNWYKYWSRGRPWIETGWEDGRAGYWKTR
jgi:hypothetical protein